MSAPTTDPAVALFAVMWALAALWHLLGNTLVGSGWSHVAVVVAVGAVLWRPGAIGSAGRPVGGQPRHGLGGGAGPRQPLAARGDGGPRHPPRGGGRRAQATRERTDATFADRVFPAARLCLLGFYAFASFAKLNSAFFDRSTSCAVFYFNESTDSLGLAGLQLDGAAWLQWSVIVGTAAVELSIPVLLVVRRTRHLGVVVGLLFHGVLAIDRTHQFFDFSSVLAALFILFLPPSAGEWVAERVGSVRARLALRDERLPRSVHLALVAVPDDRGSAGRARRDRRGRRAGPRLVAVAPLPHRLPRRDASLSCGSDDRSQSAARSVLHHVVFLLVPLLVVANGLTPYLELKTAYGWNMYANLRTVDGDSNHFVVRSTLPLTDEQADLVRIISTDDPGLALYAAATTTRSPGRSCGATSSERPDVRITYARGNATVALVHASDRARARRARPRLAGEAAALPGRRPRVAGALRPALRPRTLTGPVRGRR